MVPNPKQGKNHMFPQSRESISLLNCLGKVYDKIILDRMKKFFFANDLVPDEQIGFMNFAGELIRIIDSLLAQGSFRVKMDEASLGWRPILAGGMRNHYYLRCYTICTPRISPSLSDQC